ncbi:MAG: SH3 domain-containing protein [Leptospirales bacterium]|nr:SH3 domain-containing protein [Leptospirales bacterium]
MKSTIQILFVSLLIAAAGGVAGACKKSEPIGLLFVVGDRAPVFSAPEVVRNPQQLLQRGQSAVVLAQRVEDDRAGDRRLWYRVRVGDREGYVAYDETLIRNNVMALINVSEAQVALVTGDSLRLRSGPTLRSGVAATLRRGDVVDVLMEGSLPQTIENRRSIWLKVRSKNGIEGFAFAGFLERAPAANAAELASFGGMQGFQITRGFVCITGVSPRYFGNPALGTPPDATLQTGCGLNQVSSLPAPGECAQVSAVAAHQNIKYYRIDEAIGNEYGCEGGRLAWVSQEDAEFTDNLTAYDQQHNGNPELSPQMQAVVAYLNGSGAQLIPSTAKLAALDVPEGQPVQLYNLSVDVQGEQYRGTQSFLVSCENQQCKTIGYFEGGRTFAYDGVLYLVTSYSERAEMSIAVRRYHNGEFQQIGELYSSEEPEIEAPLIHISGWDESSNQVSRISYRVEGDHLTRVAAEGGAQ